MLLQTNSYIVPREKRAEHARLLRRFRQVLLRLGCDHFEVYEQMGADWNAGETTGRFVQIMRFRDRRHQLDVQAAERADAAAQQVVADFCELINYPYQQQQGLFAVGFYTSFLKMPPQRTALAQNPEEAAPAGSDELAPADPASADPASTDPAAAQEAADAPQAEETPTEIDMNSDQGIAADHPTLVGGMVGQDEDGGPLRRDEFRAAQHVFGDEEVKPRQESSDPPDAPAH